MKVEALLAKYSDVLNSKLFLKKAIAPRFGFYLLSMKGNDADADILTQLKSFPEIISAQYDSQVQFRDSIPDDPRWADQWHLERLGLPEVWNFGTGGLTVNNDEIVVAVLDSGIDLGHEDLQGNIWVNEAEANGVTGFDDDGNGFTDDVYGWNFIDNSKNLIKTSHGTSVAGIVGGKGNNATGITGVNWDVKMMFLNVDLVSEVIEAFNYVLWQRERYNVTNGQRGLSWS